VKTSSTLRGAQHLLADIIACHIKL